MACLELKAVMCEVSEEPSDTRARQVVETELAVSSARSELPCDAHDYLDPRKYVNGPKPLACHAVSFHTVGVYLDPKSM